MSTDRKPVTTGESLPASAAGQPAADDAKPPAPVRREVGGRQSNHGGFTLPEGIEEAPGETLWLLVARWALKQDRAVGRLDVARAFRISPRRAADVITYICTARQDRVRLEKMVERVGSGHRVALLRVTAILEPVARCAPHPAAPRPRSPAPEEKLSQAQALKMAQRLFLGQGRR